MLASRRRCDIQITPGTPAALRAAGIAMLVTAAIVVACGGPLPVGRADRSDARVTPTRT